MRGADCGNRDALIRIVTVPSYRFWAYTANQRAWLMIHGKQGKKQGTERAFGPLSVTRLPPTQRYSAASSWTHDLLCPPFVLVYCLKIHTLPLSPSMRLCYILHSEGSYTWVAEFHMKLIATLASVGYRSAPPPHLDGRMLIGQLRLS